MRLPVIRISRCTNWPGQYGVQYVIAGHLHEMLHFRLEGIDYVSMPSAGGHLRGYQKYEDGWFFGYVGVDVKQNKANFRSIFRSMKCRFRPAEKCQRVKRLGTRRSDSIASGRADVPE